MSTSKQPHIYDANNMKFIFRQKAWEIKTFLDEN
jgi:hypothetical protein